MPKQDGQATVARRAPQWSHCVDCGEAGEPHIGQLSVSASINEVIVCFAHSICKQRVKWDITYLGGICTSKTWPVIG